MGTGTGASTEGERWASEARILFFCAGGKQQQTVQGTQNASPAVLIFPWAQARAAFGATSMAIHMRETRAVPCAVCARCAWYLGVFYGSTLFLVESLRAVNTKQGRALWDTDQAMGPWIKP